MKAVEWHACQVRAQSTGHSMRSSAEQVHVVTWRCIDLSKHATLMCATAAGTEQLACSSVDYTHTIALPITRAWLARQGTPQRHEADKVRTSTWQPERLAYNTLPCCSPCGLQPSSTANTCSDVNADPAGLDTNITFPHWIGNWKQRHYL